MLTYRAFLIEDESDYQFDCLGVSKHTLSLFDDTSDADVTNWKLKKKIEKPFSVDELKIDKSILIIGANERLVFILRELVKFNSIGVSISLAYTSKIQKAFITELMQKEFSEYSIDVEDMASDFSDECICSCINNYSDILVLSEPKDEIIEDRIPLLFC